MKDITGIYKITSPSGKIYIGQSWNIYKRWNSYRKGHNCKNQRLLYHSLLKYGHSGHVFEILHELPFDVSQEALDNYEQLYMDAFTDCGKVLLNIRSGGSRGKLSDETKLRIGAANKIALKGNKPPSTGKSMEEYHGKEKADKIKKSISEKLQGKPLSKDAINKRKEYYKSNGHHNKGRIVSDETRHKQSLAKKGKPGNNKGFKQTDEAKRKMSETKRLNYLKRKGIQLLF